MYKTLSITAVITILVITACTPVKTPLVGNDHFSSLPPIVVWRLATDKSAYDEILALNPDGSGITIVARLPKEEVSRQAAVSWLQDHHNFVIWRVERSRPTNGEISLFDGKQERDCSGRRFQGQPVIFESQPMLSETDDNIYTTPLAMTQGYGKLNLQTCRYETTLTNMASGDFYATTYCVSKKWWGVENTYEGSAIYDRDIKVLSNISITANLSWSPDCSKLLGAKADGWYVFEPAQWQTPTLILTKDLSANFLMMNNPAYVVISRPSWSPDQRYFVYSIHTKRGGKNDGPGDATSYLVDISTGSERVLIDRAAYPDWRK